MMCGAVREILLCLLTRSKKSIEQVATCLKTLSKYKVERYLMVKCTCDGLQMRGVGSVVRLISGKETLLVGHKSLQVVQNV